MRQLILAGLAGCMAGCMGVPGVNTGDLIKRLQSPDYAVDDLRIVEAMARKPQLKLPARVAVCLDGDAGSRWTQADRDAVAGWAEQLQRDGLVKGVFFLPNLFVDGQGVEHARLAAARRGADVVLVVRQAYEANEKWTPFAALNLTVVGGFVAPGSRCDADFTLQAELIDVGNGFVYMSTQTAGEATIYRPTFLIEPQDAIDEARADAVAKFGPVLTAQVRGLAQAYPPRRPAAGPAALPQR